MPLVGVWVSGTVHAAYEGEDERGSDEDATYGWPSPAHHRVVYGGLSDVRIHPSKPTDSRAVIAVLGFPRHDYVSLSGSGVSFRDL
jgi:hypothetical protein